MDPKVKDIIKYGVAFAVLLLAFFGGSYILRGALGTEYPMMVVVSQSMVPTLGVGDYIIVAKIPNTNQITAASPPGSATCRDTGAHRQRGHPHRWCD